MIFKTFYHRLEQRSKNTCTLVDNICFLNLLYLFIIYMYIRIVFHLKYRMVKRTVQNGSNRYWFMV